METLTGEEFALVQTDEVQVNAEIAVDHVLSLY